MKLKKKVLPYVMALALALCLTPAAAFAATVTFDSTGGSLVGSHSYTAYQIFSGTETTTTTGEGESAVTTKTLSDIDWGSGVNPENFLAALKADATFGSGTSNLFYSISYDSSKTKTSAEAVANVIKANSFTSAMQSRFAVLAEENKTTTGVGPFTVSDSPVTIADGYYVIVDTQTGTDGQDTVKNTSILQVVGDITIKQKTNKPNFDKQIQEDSTSSQVPLTWDTEKANYGDTGQWGDEGDYEIGDKVPFQLTVTNIPDIADYEQGYKLIVRDALSSGLTFNEDSVVVTLTHNNTAVKLTKGTHYTLTVGDDPNTSGDGGMVESFYITINTLNSVCSALDITDLTALKITVDYNATLNSNAVVGNTGNPNTAYLDYSNEPSDDGMGATTPVTVVAFTYELDVDKRAESATGSKLAGAKFVLYRQNGDTSSYATIENNKITGWVDDKTQATVLTSSASEVIKIVGLDADDKYYLEETEQPAGYNKLTSPIEVYIRAKMAENTTLGYQQIQELKFHTTDSATFTVQNAENETVTGVGTLPVVNRSGSTLPETGALGTTLMVLVGAGIAIMAAVLMITRKKMSAYQE